MRSIVASSRRPTLEKLMMLSARCRTVSWTGRFSSDARTSRSAQLVVAEEGSVRGSSLGDAVCVEEHSVAWLEGLLSDLA